MTRNSSWPEPHRPTHADIADILTALERLAGGEPAGFEDEDPGDDSMVRLREVVNRTAASISEHLDTARELGMGLAEHIEVLTRVAEGDLSARVQGDPSQEILRTLKGVTNKTIDHLSQEIANKGRAEQRLKERESRYRALFEQSADAMLVMDRHQVIDCNEAAVRLFGYAGKEALLALRPAELSPEHQPDGQSSDAKAYRLVGRALALGSQRFDWLHRRRSGDTFHTEVLMTPVPSGDRRLIHMVVRDITKQEAILEEQRRLQVQLQQAQKLEAIGTLAGGIAHDFNNALGPIVGYTEMAMDDLEEDSQTRRNLGHVLVCAERARALVQQILAFSRDSGTRVAPLNAALVVAETVQLLRASLPTTIEIRTRVDTKDAWVEANPTNIHQVVMNLCTNAAHALEAAGGGLLEVDLEPLMLTPQDARRNLRLQAGPHVSLSVRDNGGGIPEAIRGRIFEPFFTTKEVGEGSGMGLAMVHGVVSDLGGAVRVESIPGEGTRFQVLLPQVHPEANLSPPTPRQTKPPGRGRVLLVDDEQIVVDFIGQSLERNGYEVTAMTSSEDAWALFERTPKAFDVVITDQTMPRLTGTALAERMLALRPELPVILCTGFSRTVTPEIAATKGIRKYLSKPFSMAEIDAAVREVLGGVKREQ